MSVVAGRPEGLPHDRTQAGPRREVEHALARDLVRMLLEEPRDCEPAGPRERPERDRCARDAQRRFRGPPDRAGVVGQVESDSGDALDRLQARVAGNERTPMGKWDAARNAAEAGRTHEDDDTNATSASSWSGVSSPVSLWATVPSAPTATQYGKAVSP